MKKLLLIFILLANTGFLFSQELLANVQVNYSQLGGSNTQVYKNLEKSLRDFINNTSWTGRRLQNFEKIKCNFAIVLNAREGNNKFNGSLVIQAVRPVFETSYDSPLINLSDNNFSFEYNENENLVFNERQFSGKNLIDVVSFYVYMILGYDADSFQNMGGQPWFEKAQKISQNSQNQRFGGWSTTEGPRTRAQLVDNLLKPENAGLRNVYYHYHRSGLDHLSKADQASAKKALAEALLLLKPYESGFQMNYPFNVFIDTKKNEIFDVFSNGSNAAVNISELRNLMNTFSPKDSETKWNKLK